MVGEPVDIEVIDFVWDLRAGGNVAHLARHGIDPEDVYSLLAFGPLTFRGLEGRTSSHVLVGRDDKGRSLLIHVIPTSAHGIWKPITGWRSGLGT